MGTFWAVFFCIVLPAPFAQAYHYGEASRPQFYPQACAGSRYLSLQNCFCVLLAKASWTVAMPFPAEAISRTRSGSLFFIALPAYFAQVCHSAEASRPPF